MLARVGARGVPMATPVRWWYGVPLKVKKLRLRTKLSNWRVTNLGKPMVSLWINIELMPSSCGMVVYRFLMSSEMR